MCSVVGAGSDQVAIGPCAAVQPGGHHHTGGGEIIYSNFCTKPHRKKFDLKTCIHVRKTNKKLEARGGPAVPERGRRNCSRLPLQFVCLSVAMTASTIVCNEIKDIGIQMFNISLALASVEYNLKFNKSKKSIMMFKNVI